MDYQALLNIFPAPLATVVIATLPVVELRGAILIAIGGYGMSGIEAFFWAVLGNMIPAFFLVFFLEKVSTFIIAKSKIGESFFKWLFERTHRRFLSKYQKYGAFALVIFVAIPLPVTGVWTASVAAFIFGIKSRVAVPYLLSGVIIAGIIVTLISLGIF